LIHEFNKQCPVEKTSDEIVATPKKTSDKIMAASEKTSDKIVATPEMMSDEILENHHESPDLDALDFMESQQLQDIINSIGKFGKNSVDEPWSEEVEMDDEIKENG